jgi:peptide-methionine (S)-S-oxide reductase
VSGDRLIYYTDNWQQYLAKNPHGYRCHSATGAPMPWPVEGIQTRLG